MKLLLILTIFLFWPLGSALPGCTPAQEHPDRQDAQITDDAQVTEDAATQDEGDGTTGPGDTDAPDSGTGNDHHHGDRTVPGSFCTPCTLADQAHCTADQLTCAISSGDHSPEGSGICTTPCSPHTSGPPGNTCPAGTSCTPTVGGGHHCLPIMGCQDPCIGQPPCPWGSGCDPDTGECAGDPEYLCRPCLTDHQCGTGNTSCLYHPAIDQPFCSISCNQFLKCPEGYTCVTMETDTTEGWCIPLAGTCHNPCEGVTCPLGSLCQPTSGDRCLRPDQALCGGPCLTNDQCGEERDLCVVRSPGEPGFCSRECDTCSNDLDCPTADPCQGGNTCPYMQQCVDGTCRLRCIGGTCYGCRSTEECPSGAICYQNRCHTCPLGFSCTRVPDVPNNRTLYGCVPDTTRCPAWLLGTPCGGAYGDTCGGQNHICSDPDSGGYCTRPCTADRDCPEGWRRCLPLAHDHNKDNQGSTRGICAREEPYGWDQCGYLDPLTQAGEENGGEEAEESRRGVGAPCSSQHPCQEGSCYAFTMGGQVRGICTHACDTDQECEADTICAPMQGAWPPKVCLPRSCACMEKAPTGERDLIRELLLATTCTFGFNPARDYMAVPEPVKTDPFRMHGFGEEHRLPLQGAQQGANRSQMFTTTGAAATDGDEDGNGGRPNARPLTRAIAQGAEQQGYAHLARAWHPAARGESPAKDHKSTPPPPDPGATFDPTTFTNGEGLVNLAEGLEAVYGAAHTPAPPREQLMEQIASLPDPVAAAAGHLLKASAEAAALRDRALEGAARITPIYGQFINTLFYRMPEVLFATEGMASDHWFRDPRVREFLLKHYRHDLMLQAALTVAGAIDQIQWAPLTGSSGFHLDMDTPLGRLIIADSSHDHHRLRKDYGPNEGTEGEDEAVLLIIDTGGDDLYEIPAGANVGVSNPVSIAIDLEGNDTYSYQAGTRESGSGTPPAGTLSLLPADTAGRYPAPSPSSPIPPGQGANQSRSQVGRQGSGRLGIGILVDFGGGDDQYSSLRMSQGFGMLGVGVLLDDGGNDRYAGESFCQGSALFGTGILLDLDGEDQFLAWHGSQGYGGTMGFGALVNLGSGADLYHAVAGDENLSPSSAPEAPRATPADETVIFPWGEDRALNHSLCQGAAGGIPPYNTHSEGIMAGGLGLLVGGTGDDYYRAGAGAQGRAQWSGRGNLIDLGGNDRYDSPALAQASADNYSLAVLLDYGGDDQFNVTATRLYHGHLAYAGEFSGAVFYNISGRDRYVANARAAGFARSNSLSLFVDVEGDDTYEMGDSTTLGMAMSHPLSTRKQYTTIAAFLDGGGTDRYYRPDLERRGGAPAPEPPPIGDNSTWSQNHSENQYGERGNAMDTEGHILYPKLYPAP